MKRIIVLLALMPLFAWTQDAANDWTIPISVEINESPAEITLTWNENAASGTTYNIFRKNVGSSGWGSSIGSVTVGDTSYTDVNVSVGSKYEYLIQKVAGATLYSWGYVNAGIRTELAYNRGDILVLVDSTHFDSLTTELAQLEVDLYNDGWMVTTLSIGASLTPPDVKALINAQYTSLPNLKALYLLGHIAVPYSGNLYPDAHPDHEGAWPADVYYADMDGSWTDVSVNNTVATDTRNDNVPGDGKFDQSTVPSTLELQVCRVDFNDLPVYTESELDLLRNYLNKAHEFKIAEYVPQEKALYDQGGFTGMQEGFAQNGIRNFAPFVGANNVEELDYFSTLTNESYLWSYGCGAGSYTSAGALDNGTSLTSAELAGTDMEAVFTMIFGSYFGDWDKTNNLMRCNLANGKVLSVSWAGRPNWHYHTMAQGDHLGNAAKMSQDLNTDYISLNLGGGFVTGEGVHVAQLGDPSLRTYYVEPPSNLMVSNNNNDADLTWTASADVGIDGYNIYRRTPSAIWEKVNTSIIVGTSFTDSSIPFGENYEYMVKAVKLKTNGSGSFYNESLGTSDSEIFTVGLESEIPLDLKVYPVPANDLLNIVANSEILDVQLFAITGQLVYQGQSLGNQLQIDVNDFNPGAYLLQVKTDNGMARQQIIVR